MSKSWSTNNYGWLFNIGCPLDLLYMLVLKWLSHAIDLSLA